MKKNNMKVSKLYGKKKLILALTGVFGILVGVIVLLTYYGQSVGSFSIRLDEGLEKRAIYISEDPSFSWFDSKLEAEPVDGATITTYNQILKEDCLNTNGSYIGTNKSYISYTFYLKNMGSETVEIASTFKIDKATKGLDDVSWLWVIEDDTISNVYKKDDKSLDDPDWPGYDSFDYPQTNSFYSDSIVYHSSFKSFNPGDVKKFTIICWLEAGDPDMDTNMKDGLIRYNLTFSAYKEENAL